MKKLSLAILMTGVLSSATVFAQEYKPCIAPSLSNEQFATNPAAKAANDALEAYTRDFIANSPQNKGASVDSPILVFPVVVHIFHEYGAENITDDQVYSAIEILNRDFKKQNADTADVLPYFKSRIGKTNIEFRMAQIDPQGNCTRGVTRTVSSLTRNGRQHSQMADIINWDTRKYLNIYIVRAIEGAGAFSYHPGAFPVGSKMHGVVCSYTQFGGVGSSTGNFAERTIPHEVGHYFNLPHTWGQTNTPGVAENCTDDDGVDDTPNTIGVGNQGCNRNMASCAGDPDPYTNVENIMDYSNCARMFTIGQVQRMRAAMRGSAARNTLWQPANLVATGTNDGYTPVRCAPKADFDGPSTTCTNTAVEFQDKSWKDTVSAWKWSVVGNTNGVTIADPTAKNSEFSFAEPGDYTIKLKVSNAAGSDSIVKEKIITVYPSEGNLKSPVKEEFESTDFLNNGWRLESADTRVWERTTTAAFSGSSCFYIRNWNGNPAGQADAFITPSMNFANANKVTVRFKAAHALRNSSTADQFNIYISKNCGKTYTKQAGFSGATLSTTSNKASSYTPASKSEWKEFSKDLTQAVKSSGVLIKFENKSDAGNNLYIDDLEIVTDEVTGVHQIIRFGGLSIYPNPFENSTKVSFNLLNDEKVYLGVYDLLGREVAVLANERMPSGDHQFDINAQTAKLNDAGFYFIKLKAGNEVAIEKVLFTK